MAVGRPLLAMFIEQVWWRSAGTCDVNRASVWRSAGTCDVNRASAWRSVSHYLRCRFGGRSRQEMPVRDTAEELCQYFDENASLKPPWSGEERVRDFIDFSCNRT